MSCSYCPASGSSSIFFRRYRHSLISEKPAEAITPRDDARSARNPSVERSLNDAVARARPAC